MRERDNSGKKLINFSSPIEIYRKICGLPKSKELPNTLELPEELFLPGKFLGNLGTAIRDSFDDGLERGQRIDYRFGRLVVDRVEVGTKDRLEWPWRFVDFILRQPRLIRYHVHPNEGIPASADDGDSFLQSRVLIDLIISRSLKDLILIEAFLSTKESWKWNSLIRIWKHDYKVELDSMGFDAFSNPCARANILGQYGIAYYRWDSHEPSNASTNYLQQERELRLMRIMPDR